MESEGEIIDMDTLEVRCDSEEVCYADPLQRTLTSMQLYKLTISAPPRSTQYDEKPLGLFWQFRPSTSNNNSTLYHNLLQDLSIRRKTRDRVERQFTQLLLSDRGQKKPAGKKPRGGKKSAGNLGRNHGSNSK